MQVEVEDLGVLTPADGVTFLKDTLDGTGSEQVLYYGFTLEEALDVNVGLRQLDYAADLFLEDANAQVLYESLEAGTTNERAEVLGRDLLRAGGDPGGGRECLCAPLWCRRVHTVAPSVIPILRRFWPGV